jgi:Na+/H+-dicarboxylate symporter
MHAHPDAPVTPIVKKPFYRQLYFWVLVAIVAGILVGWLAPSFAVRWSRSAPPSSPR